MPEKNAHCSYCGAAFQPGQPWPRTCAACSSVSFLNPLPVAVVLAPIDAGLLLVQRAIEPCAGQFALPGGFINYGESWQQAAVREVWEETGLILEADEIQEFIVRSAPDSTLLIFGLAKPRLKADLPPFRLSNETAAVTIANQPQRLGFSLHTEAMKIYFEHLGGKT